VERFVAFAFDLILMDINRPLMDGLAATQAIRVIECSRGTRGFLLLHLHPTTVRMIALKLRLGHHAEILHKNMLHSVPFGGKAAQLAVC
jgi:CheY-like chemotaxis protein